MSPSNKLHLIHPLQVFCPLEAIGGVSRRPQALTATDTCFWIRSRWRYAEWVFVKMLPLANGETCDAARETGGLKMSGANVCVIEHDRSAAAFTDAVVCSCALCAGSQPR